MQAVLEQVSASAPSTCQDELVRQELPLVHALARRMARRLPAHIDVRDLIGAGAGGLLRAAREYDPERTPSFRLYAWLRIRYAMQDELRAFDPVKRCGRRRLLQITRASRELQRSLGRPPTDDEIAHHLDMPLERYQRELGELSIAASAPKASSAALDQLQANNVRLDDALHDTELKRRLTFAIGELPERTQRVLKLYYEEESTQEQIGRALGVTESRVCQILAQATCRLRELLSKPRNIPAKTKEECMGGKRLEVRETWAKRVERWGDSGLTAKAFGDEIGVNAAALMQWKYKLKKENLVTAKPQGASARAVSLSRPVIAARDELLKAKAHRTHRDASVETHHARLELVIGTSTLRIPNDFDDATLRRALAIVREVEAAAENASPAMGDVHCEAAES